jgi:hypothetical protein
MSPLRRSVGDALRAKDKRRFAALALAFGSLNSGKVGARSVACIPLGSHRASNFRRVWFLGRAAFLHEPLLKAVSGQALEEPPVRQFSAVQANLDGH